MSSCTENIQGALYRARNSHLHPKQKEQKEAKTSKRKRIGIDVQKGDEQKGKTLLSSHNCASSLVRLSQASISLVALVRDNDRQAMCA